MSSWWVLCYLSKMNVNLKVIILSLLLSPNTQYLCSVPLILFKLWHWLWSMNADPHQSPATCLLLLLSSPLDHHICHILWLFQQRGGKSTWFLQTMANSTISGPHKNSKPSQRRDISFSTNYIYMLSTNNGNNKNQTVWRKRYAPSCPSSILLLWVRIIKSSSYSLNKLYWYPLLCGSPQMLAFCYFAWNGPSFECKKAHVSHQGTDVVKGQPVIWNPQLSKK